MACRVARTIRRLAYRAHAASCVLALSLCSGALAADAAPTPVAATPGIRATTPARHAQPTPPASSARRVDCEHYVETLSTGTDHTALKKPEVVELALRAPDLSICAAVKADSAVACEPLIKTGRSGQPLYSESARDCLYMQSIFHEARAYPNTHSFMWSDLDMAQCQDPKGCAVLREALRTGDEKKCQQVAGDSQRLCRAFLKLDKSLCRAKRAETKHVEGVEAFCEKAIAARSFLAPGLIALADSGSTREAELAKAALGRSGACARYAKAALDLCLAAAPVETATPATAAVATPSPARMHHPPAAP